MQEREQEIERKSSVRESITAMGWVSGPEAWNEFEAGHKKGHGRGAG